MSGPSRPRRLVVVTGTATEVGKTWVSAALLAAARRRGLSVAARKPLQSFAAGDAAPTDAERLAAATGEPAGTVCPPERSYPLAMAPPMAAAALGLDCPGLAGLVRAVEGSWARSGTPGPGGIDLALVEGAGGAASPIGSDGATTADLARALGADAAVIVADPALGVINSVRLTAAALAPVPTVVHLNRFDGGDDLQRRNLEWLSGRDGLRVTVTVDGLLEALIGMGPAPLSGGAGPGRCG